MRTDEPTVTIPMFGHYRLDAELGRGGMGVVHRAYDTRRNRVVALKRMPRGLAADEEFRVRFRRESALAAKLREPHVVPIHDYGEIDGQLYIDMRLVEGVDLAAVLERGPLALPRAVDVISQIADALDAAHADGLVHRDVKPSNILLVGDGPTVAERGFAYLADFGIAADLTSSTLSRPGPALGTVAYMAPERLVGDPCDHRIDVYSLACVLFEAVVGRRPYAADDLLQAVLAHLHQPIPRPSQLRPGLPPALDDLLAAGMAKQAADRPDTCGEIAAAAREIAAVWTAQQQQRTDRTRRPVPPADRGRRPAPNGPAKAPRDPKGAATARIRRRRGRRGLVAAALGSALAVAAGVVFAVQAFGAPAAPFTTVATLPTGSSPAEVALSPDGSRVYVTNLRSDTVSVLDAATGRPLAAPIAVGAQPNSIRVSTDGRRAYVTSTGAGTLSIIDTASDTVAATVAVGRSVDGLSLSPDGRRAYVGIADTGTVVTVDTATARTVGAPVRVGDHPYGMATSTDGRTLYVPNFGSDTVSVVDTARLAVVATVPVGHAPVGAVVSPDGRTLYVGNQRGGTLSVVDTATNAVRGAPVAVCPSPVGLATTGDGGTVYVTCRDSDEVRAVRTADRALSVPYPVVAAPVAVAVADDGRVFVVGERAEAVGVLRPESR